MEAARTDAGSGKSRRSRTRIVAILGFAFFVVVSILVHMRVLAGLDSALMQAKQQLSSNVLYVWSETVAVVISAEFSVVYAAAGSFLLLRAGLGKWSFAPAAFLLLVPVEALMKLFLYQPHIPRQFKHSAPYPLTSVDLGGSFPSGHAIRTAFLFVFLAILLWYRGGLAARASSIGLLLLALGFGFARIYMGDHWPSDVVAGLALGASLALLVAPPVAARLGARTR